MDQPNPFVAMTIEEVARDYLETKVGLDQIKSEAKQLGVQQKQREEILRNSIVSRKTQNPDYAIKSPIGVLDVTQKPIKVKFSADVVVKACAKYNITNAVAQNIYHDIKEETKRVLSCYISCPTHHLTQQVRRQARDQQRQQGRLDSQTEIVRGKKLERARDSGRWLHRDHDPFVMQYTRLLHMFMFLMQVVQQATRPFAKDLVQPKSGPLRKHPTSLLVLLTGQTTSVSSTCDSSNFLCFHAIARSSRS